MPIFFLIVGILLIVVAINDKMKDLSGLLKEDFIPSGNQPGFATWIVAIFVIGSLGYVKEFKSMANAFLVLIVLVMILSNRGFFENFNKAVKGLK